MKIDGPISVNVLDDDVQQKRTLEINFTQEFQQLQSAQQSDVMKSYIQSLYQNAQSLDDNQADKAGVLLIMQIAEQLLPYIQKGELDLSETIGFEMALQGMQSEISVSLSDFKIN